MPDRRRAALPGALLILAALLLAACGGTTATAEPTSAAPGDATPTPAAEATEAPATDAPIGEATPDVPLPTFDLDALAAGLPGVDSYRTSVSISGVEQYQSVVVKEPVLSKAITVFDDGDVSQRFVIIGDEAWQASGADGDFEAVPSQLASSLLFAFDPAFMLGAYASADLGGAAADQGTEQKNGVQARHLKIDSATLVGVAAQMPAGSAIDIWVAEDGYIVAWEMSGFPDDANISIQVTNVNDPANKVDAPN
jgi:hypothetical protein